VDILEMAKELGKAIADSDLMAAVKKAEDVQNNDEKAQQLIGEYNLKRMQLAQRVQKEDVTQEELEAVQKELSDEFDKLMQYSVISDFITARKELDAVLEQVNNVISFYVTGKTPDGGCSGSCSSCSGCH
jgi:cell fate (sporulation/competence/biofilm development) regulator YlbF (YheA/YmcA/DUF963 family)